MAKRHPWTTAQDALLAETAAQGVDECRRELFRRFGVRRTNGAVKMRASRIGVSLTAYQTCPQCGRKEKRLKYTGLCQLCHERSFLTPSEQRAQALRDMERTGEDEHAIEDARRARAKERQRRHRGKSCY